MMDEEEMEDLKDAIETVVLETVEKQGEIICLQSEVIDELFVLLAQFIAVEDMDKLTVLKKINLAAQIRREIS